MWFFSRLLQTYLVGRLLGGRRRAARRSGAAARVAAASGSSAVSRLLEAHARRSRVTVSGCCLPIPLAVAATAAVGARALLRR
jgi:hypothetical protein